MAVCNLNKNLDKAGACAYSLPQVVDIYLANYADVTGVSVGAGVSGGTIVSGITMSGSTKWYHVEPSKNSASWGDTLQLGGNNNKYKQHTVTFGYSAAYDAGFVDTVDALALGRYIAVLKMADGSYIMLGRLTGLEAMENDNVSYTGSGDASAESGLMVTLTTNTTESALPLSEEAIAVVVG